MPKLSVTEGIVAIGPNIIVDSVLPPSTTTSGIHLTESTRKALERDPNQLQRVVAVGQEAYDAGVRPGQFVFIRRDLFVPTFNLAGKMYDQPSHYQVAMIDRKSVV